MTDPRHPRDRYLTVYGRKPVLAVLDDPLLPVARLLVAEGARGAAVEAILAAARRRGIEPRRAPASAVTRLSRNGRQDQGVALDVEAPRMAALADGLPPPDAPARVFLLDGITTPANVGLILRSATAAGADGVVLPRRGSPEVGPLVIKASAGVAFRAPILRVETATEAAKCLRAAGFTLLGLRGQRAEDLFTAQLPERAAFVLGNEATGVSPAVAAHIRRWISIPMAEGVESLNVAMAATVVAFELSRRQASKSVHTGA